LIPSDDTAVEDNLFESMKWSVKADHTPAGDWKPLSF